MKEKNQKSIVLNERGPLIGFFYEGCRRCAPRQGFQAERPRPRKNIKHPPPQLISKAMVQNVEQALAIAVRCRTYRLILGSLQPTAAQTTADDLMFLTSVTCLVTF